MIVIDTSAAIATMFDEEDGHIYDRAMERASIRLISAATRVELTFVAEGRKGDAGRALLDRFLHLTGAEIVAFTPLQADLASRAFRMYGKGRHAAALNIGDCFSYALARATGYPLLFKGNDFSQTDMKSALEG